ncbi:hypothetical protein B0W47_08870 [Komagataeibacter nataicola]|uniref:Uncharacterized protein n=1 Tax=Komagataeibacter nataicola TaxID=265960 RepID=A0A9N7H0V7_9PROT|nr:hypothetical protein [Komagataeibacter nataicola]AQU87567.1 hypothetical protein B0W47_08870 [Komagataeibacter nataicola]PYD67064.1 hypothetical protein CDI09_05280 [Komagataeibacter nataicola]WEQ55299.1 hypothetical protein LV564_14565 [Komagataeibacter nataicola]WNM09819.1 hypothetical protein RI056_08115 [Komagataeibacter nataicola]
MLIDLPAIITSHSRTGLQARGAHAQALAARNTTMPSGHTGQTPGGSLPRLMVPKLFATTHTTRDPKKRGCLTETRGNAHANRHDHYVLWPAC